MKLTPKRRLRILDFDLENRPLNYLGPEWTGAEITAIGWSWVGEDKVHTLMLDRYGRYVDDEGVALPAEKALSMFRDELLSADLVTGHYIRRHDLPILNGALMEYGLPTLRSVLVQDTQRDLVRRKDLSASQENLAAMLGLAEPKYGMNQSMWRAANRLTEAGIEEARKRVVDDVIQHKALREALAERGLLKPPRRWNP